MPLELGYSAASISSVGSYQAKNLFASLRLILDPNHISVQSVPRLNCVLRDDDTLSVKHDEPFHTRSEELQKPIIMDNWQRPACTLKASDRWLSA